MKSHLFTGHAITFKLELMEFPGHNSFSFISCQQEIILISLLFYYDKASNNLTAMCYFNYYFRIFNYFSVIFLTTNVTIIKFSVYQIFIGKVDNMSV